MRRHTYRYGLRPSRGWIRRNENVLYLRGG
jgi:hypothetical protein